MKVVSKKTKMKGKRKERKKSKTYDVYEFPGAQYWVPWNEITQAEIPP